MVGKGQPWHFFLSLLVRRLAPGMPHLRLLHGDVDLEKTTFKCSKNSEHFLGQPVNENLSASGQLMHGELLSLFFIYRVSFQIGNIVFIIREYTYAGFLSNVIQ